MIDNEKQWIRDMKAGDASAFRQLYDQYARKLYWRLLQLVGDEAEADDILQRIFIKIWEKRAQLDPAYSFTSYIFKLSQHEVYDYFRAKSRRLKLLDNFSLSSPASINQTEEHIHFKETESLVEQAMYTLSPKRRQVFELCRFEGKSYLEVSQLLGISVNTVKNHLVKAAAQLKERLSVSKPGVR